jgi:hypothetical protein
MAMLPAPRPTRPALIASHAALARATAAPAPRPLQTRQPVLKAQRAPLQLCLDLQPRLR